LEPNGYKVLFIIAGLALYIQFDITTEINPMAWREFLGGRGIGRPEAPS
jgi:hypothetical protein